MARAVARRNVAAGCLEETVLIYSLSPPRVVWKRSVRARRLILRVDPLTGDVVLTLPVGATQRQGQIFLQKHADWIRNALETLPPQAILKEGWTVPIEGLEKPILHEPDARRGVWLDENGLHVSGQEEHVPRRVRAFLRRLAGKRLVQAVGEWSVRMCLAPSSVDLREVRSRWGSCTREGRIMLSWRLLLVPLHVRDYVIVHELAHLRHFNHGPDFWALVERFCVAGRTGRLAAERWLRENGTALLRIV